MREVYSPLNKSVPAKQLKQFVTLFGVIFFFTLISPVGLFAQGRAPVISYPTPNTYPIGTAIAPLTPTNTGGAVAAPAYSNAPFNLSSGPGTMFFLAVDKAGNVYATTLNGTAVTEFPAAGNYSSTVTIGSGFVNTTGIAVDAAGNLYVADAGAKLVKKIPAGSNTPVTIATGFNSPQGLALDAAGNVYIADGGNGTVYEISVRGGRPVALFTGLGAIEGIAVDSQQNIYVANPANTWITELVPGESGLQVTVGSGLKNPYGVAVDPMGNVFVVETGGEVVEVPASGAQVNVTGFLFAYGIAIDALGNLDVSANYGLQLWQDKPVGGYYLSSALPAGLSFDPATGIISGQPTAESPATNYTVTAYNAYGSGSAVVNIKTVSTNTAVTIQFSKGTSSPAYPPYTLLVTNGTTSVTVTAILADTTATITVNGMAERSGKASGPIALSVGSNYVTVVVTAEDGTTKETHTFTIIRPSTNAKLASLKISSGTLSPAFNTNTTSYTDAVTYATTFITVTPTVTVTGATIKVNGEVVASGSTSPAVNLSVGSNTITTVVTAQDGVTTDTYTVTVNRAAASANANLSNLIVSKGTLSPSFTAGQLSYTDMVTNGTTSVTITPTVADPTATVSVNGTTVTSGKASAPIALSVGSNTVFIYVTAQDGSDTQSYDVTVIRPSTNAKLTSLKISSGTLTPAFNTNTTSYTDAVTNAIASVTVTPTVAVTGATVKVNGTTVASGEASAAIALTVGSNTITTVVTAQDGVTTDTYTITVTRAAGGENIADEAASVDKPTETPQLADDGITVHPGLSPNGDGINDFLQIDNIGQYPDNMLSIMNRNGQLVFEAKGYDNATKVFDGHSNKNGQMQLPGTYFYSLDYTVKGIIKHKTGFLVLKY